ncbi:hypothetical protein CN378_18825 [Bacillus sp. AFS015802]|uniref:hypothetical protein n=1 Tax=Bacillus sp. AFS015802 TaxID=2033486 RepID=UPI000BF33488|nr:hypothetical protein [Bacillus sp. AFS015802]PFA63089.1 hypothetical protein CN378_18825 [Bacillus sp. AFS015802]
MGYLIIGVILIFVVFMMIRASKPEPLKENRYDIYSYVVMEEENEEEFMKADHPLWGVSERYPFLHPGQILCRVDRNKDVFDEEWDEIRKYSNFTKGKEPYYILFDEYRADKERHTKMPWDQKVFETTDMEEIKQWCEEFEKEIVEKHGTYSGQVLESND